MNSLTEIQKMIRSFNKMLERADKAGNIPNDFYAQIVDLIDYDRMTQKGYAKAGKKYLESMSYKDILAYQADIRQAKGLIELANLSAKVDITGAKDIKSLLWKLHDKIDKFKAFDSDYVYDAINGEVEIDFKKLALEMYKYLNNPEYGLSDFQAWYDEQLNLEE